ncbi:hypothetical protein [Microtetraspora malaysiensis]|uniref:Uncharacterized protein n=1 Tax=Microtetraspora malaysiensis TaxID=161358 RepID=A0ABW6SKH6_9ACTN
MALDVVAFPLAQDLLGCLCGALEESLGGPPCRCCVYPGAQVPADSCCDCGAGQGQAWVRVAKIFPAAARFPEQSFAVESCASRSWGVELEVGVYRCVATVDDEGNPPSCEQVEHDAAVILDDAAAMRRAVACCFADGEHGNRDLVVGEWTPIGPSGGCGGGSMTVTIQAYDCACP